MMIAKSQDSFECWAKSRPEFKTEPPILGFALKEIALIAWKASREALECEELRKDKIAASWLRGSRLWW